MRNLGLIGTYLGMIVLNIGLLMPLTVFLYTGFIRALPQEYEEAAQVDGPAAPDLRARRVSAAAARSRDRRGAHGLVIWNDFFIPLIFLSGAERDAARRDLLVRRRVPQRENLIFAGIADRARADPRLLPLRAAAPDPRLLGGSEGLDGIDHVRGRQQDLSRRDARGRGARSRDRRRRVHGARRAVGLRQDDDAADDRRARGDHRGRDPDRRPRRQRARPDASATSRWSSRTTRSTRT